MAVGFTTWTVLPHDPFEKLTENLWRVEGRLNAQNRRVMVVARLGDGRLLMHNPIALEDSLMAELDGWGEVAALLVPNAFHRQDTHIMKERYPKARVYCPRGATRAVARAAPVDGTYDDVPRDADVDARHLEGIAEREGVLRVRSADGTSQVYCDTLLNLPPMGGIFGWMLHPTGQLAVPRPTRWVFMKDREALRADLRRLGEEDGLRRVISGHGKAIVEGAAEAMKGALATLD